MEEKKESGLAVIAPKSLGELKELASTLAPSTILAEAFRGKPADIVAAIMTGAEVGLSPMQSLRAIEMIKGRPAWKAEAKVALVRASGVCEFFELIESTAERATYETKRRGARSPRRLTFTMQQAQQAGLAGGDNWRKYPDAMLRARCSSALCTIEYSDVVLGMMDTTEAEVADAQAPRVVAAAPAAPTRPPASEVLDSVAVVVEPPEPVEPAQAKRDSKRQRMKIVDAAPTEVAAEHEDPPAAPQPGDRVADALAAIAAAKSRHELASLAAGFKSWSDDEKAAVRAPFAARRAELGDGA